MAVDVGTATGYLDLDISGFLSGLKTAQSEAQSATSSMSDKFASGFKSLGGTFESVGSFLTKSITTPVAGLGAAAAKLGIDFESAMAKVKAISGAQGEDFERLTAKAREMGASTMFSASESAEAFQYMAMAGWDVENMLGGISGVMDLAAASGENLGTVSDIVTDAMSAFGMSAAETSKVMKDGVELEVNNTTRFVDALAAASNSSNTNVAMLGESFKYVASTAGSMGYSVEDVSVALGLMANQGIKASQAGTTLRTILSNMANPSATMKGAMDAIGASLTDEEGNMKSLMEVMQDLRKGFNEGYLSMEEFNERLSALNQQFYDGKIDEDEYYHGMQNLMTAMYGAEGAEKAMIAAQLAGKTGMAGLLSIVGTSDEEFNKLSESIYNAAGTSKEMAEIMKATLQGQLKELGSMLEELGLQFFDVIKPMLEKAIQWIKGLVEQLQELSTEQKEQIVKWAVIAAAIGPVLLTIGKLLTSIGTLITTFKSVSTAIKDIKAGFGLMQGAAAGVSAPILAIVAVIAVLVAAFVHLWQTNEEFRNKITAIWDGIKSKFEEFGQGIVERLNAIGFDFKNFSEVMSAVWNRFCELLGPVFENVLSQLGVIISSALDFITGVFDLFIGIFTGNWEQAWTGVKEIFASIWNLIKGTFESWANAFRGVADVFLGWFGTSWEELWTGVKDYFVGIWNGIKAFFESIINAIQAFLGPAWNAIYNTIKVALDLILQTIKTIFDTIFNTIKTVMTTIYNTLQSIWNNILYAITLIIVAIQDIIKNIFEAIKAFLTGNTEETKNRLVSAWTTAKNLVSELVKVLSNTITTTFNAIKTSVSTITDATKTVISNAWSSIKTTTVTIVTGLKQSITTTFEAMKTAMSSAMTSAKSNIVNAMTEAKNGAIKAWDGIKETFTTIGKNMIQGIIDGIGSMVSKLYSSIKEALSGLVDRAKDALDINSPSGVMRDQVGKWLPLGIAEGFKNSMGKATNEMEKSLNEGIDSINSDDINVGIGSNMLSITESVAEYYESMEQRLAESVENMRRSIEVLISLGMLAVNNANIGYVGYGGFSKNVAGDNVGTNNDSNTDSGNKTYVFYTTKAIDEIEAARQMQKAERDMAEGFA